MEDKNKLLSNYTQRLENLQQTLIENNDLENIFGDGKSLVDNELIPITHNFSEGAKRLIKCVEDCVFINVHKNPTNTKNIDNIEKSLYSFTMEEYFKKEKLCQE